MAHHPAAFINAIAEEGTKAEAVEWLQKTWNENCELRAALRHIDRINDNPARYNPEIDAVIRSALEQNDNG
jgi:hypothetical protein